LQANREHKDSLFRAILNEAQKASKLYADIKGVPLGIDVVVEMKNLDLVLTSRLRNDIAFIVNGVLIVIFEHQASLNMNMPLRFLQYTLVYYEAYFKLGNALYQNKMIKLPKPEFYVFYNGTDPYPATGVMKLSDAFMDLGADEKPSLELIVNVININYDSNAEVLKRNETLRGYAAFVAKIRREQGSGATLEEAIRTAMNECLAEDILKEELVKYREEVDAMFSLIYDEKRALEVAREEGREEGREDGEVRKLLKQIIAKRRKLKTREHIIDELELSASDIAVLDRFDEYAYLLQPPVTA
jgi:hypothetical protein